jgi:hypothetical protein
MAFTNLENLRKLLRIKGAQPTNVLQDLYYSGQKKWDINVIVLTFNVK